VVPDLTGALIALMMMCLLGCMLVLGELKSQWEDDETDED
jgi:hypothetical protein